MVICVVKELDAHDVEEASLRLPVKAFTSPKAVTQTVDSLFKGGLQACHPRLSLGRQVVRNFLYDRGWNV